MKSRRTLRSIFVGPQLFSSRRHSSVLHQGTNPYRQILL